MKILLVYSSKTGNTKKIAKAIEDVLEEEIECFPVEQAPSADNYDLIIIGFWVYRGNADLNTLDYIKKLKDKKIALFATLGAYPDSDHANKSIDRVYDLLKNYNSVLGHFICQGKIDPLHLERSSDNPDYIKNHPITPERKKRIEEAAKHPDEKDIINAQDFILKIYSDFKIQNF